MKTDDLRETFLDFFKSKKHEILPSGSLIPKDDPTLLFTSAGMNQFKRQFMGKDIKYKRVATVQKCLRTGDLNEVGKTPYHHTFFEMLGNFSFGDYFKKEAIAWAWEFLTERLKLKPESLWVSVYKNDEETFKIWKDKIKVPEDKIIEKGDKENFWPSEAITKGPNGPCGPCSEIYYDRGRGKGCKRKTCKPGCSCNRFIEVWNLVFTQYVREGSIGKRAKLTPLPNKNIDTGMGLERMAQVVQNVDSNFKIDIFKPIVDYIVKNTNAKCKRNDDYLFKVHAVCDHVRAATFAVSEGVIPSNEERGYVVRKLIRRSVDFISSLGINKPFLYKIVPVVSDVMSKPYPELKKRRENISQIILEEEKKYLDIMTHMPKIIEEKVKKIMDQFTEKEKLSSRDEIAKALGQISFELRDTYGATEVMTEQKIISILKKDYGLTNIDKRFIKKYKKTYKENMLEQKKRSRQKSQMKDEIFTKSLEDELADIKPISFAGYERLKIKSKVIAIMKDGKRVNEAKKSDEIQIILDKTPFYAESGGQVGDTGIIRVDRFEAEIYDTKVLNSMHLHYAKVKSDKIKVNQVIEAMVDNERRLKIAKNHTATHLLQFALREVLGSHVEQSGSLVDDKRLRFDFTHFKQIKEEQLERIEEIVNNHIQSNHQVRSEIMKLQEAKRKQVLAFFKEKYSQIVRVVSIGDISRELCGGTHVDSTGKIGLFKIISEGSIASGIRRIEAVTSNEALKFINREARALGEVKKLLKTDLTHLHENIQNLIEENKKLKKEISSFKINSSKMKIDKILTQAKTKKHTKIVICKLDDADMNSLRLINDMIRQKADSVVSVLASIIKNKVILIVGLSKDLAKKDLNANNIIQKINKELNSKGGGRPDLAQAGGGDPRKLKKALDKAYKIISDELSRGEV